MHADKYDIIEPLETEVGMEVGDHLVTARSGYTHHGIYAGDGRVIHYSGLSDGLKAGAVEMVSLDSFGSGRPVAVRPEPLRIYKGKAAVDRALLRIGEDTYNVFTNNCEHFVNHCIFGVKVSQQVVGLAAGIAGSTSLSSSLLTQGLKPFSPFLKDSIEKVTGRELSPVASTSVDIGLKVGVAAVGTVVTAPVLLPVLAVASLVSFLSS